MKFERALGILMLALLVVGVGLVSMAAAQEPPGGDLRLLRSDEQGLVLELIVDDFDVETVKKHGEAYHRLLIPGLAQTTKPGEPQVPTRGELVGLPSTEGVSVQIVDASFETFHGYRLYPAPDFEIEGANLSDLSSGDVQEVFALEEDIYVSDAFYPGTPVEIGQADYLRDQPVAQVQFYPVQYNPVTGELRLYRRILARITWDTPVATMAEEARGASPAYENLLKKTILNYDSLERPPVVKTNSSPSIPGTEVAANGGLTPTLKIGVTEDGLYELTYDDLIGAGWDLSGVDPRTIKISNRGSEIPIHVHGEGDGVFTTTDHILFYGTAITDVYTTKNIYWLSAGGRSGQRMGERDGNPSGSATVPDHFPVTLHAEKDTYYWLTMPDGESQDHWFWEDKLTAPTAQTHTVTLNNISTAASTATVRVRLKGRTDVSTDPDHHTRIYLNGVKIDDQLWDGQIIYDHEVMTVPHSLLRDGDNNIMIETVGDTGASVDQLYVNWIEIGYRDTYVAEDDALLFHTPEVGTFQFEVAGFSDNTVQVFDVTDSTDVAIITNTVVVAAGGDYMLRFEDEAQLETRYLALTSAQRQSPASIEVDRPSSWKSTSHGADYIIITHGDFYTSSLTLANYRIITSGMRVATVKVGDIYDEFNEGIFNPQAIRDFLSHAYHNWTAPAPTYVLLVGDATQDYKDNYDTGTINYVPSQIIQTDQLEASSDNWFVLVSGDDVLPDMFIGRLSAQETSQVDDIMDKIIHYEQNPPEDPWNKSVLLVADDDEASFETMSDQLAERLPFYYTATKVYAADYPPGDPTVDIANAINGGAILVNYTGHGAEHMWGQWHDGTNLHRIFDLADINALTNTHKLPMVTTANCLNGFFSKLRTSTAVAEAFQRLQDRGAVAVWAPTALGYPSGHRTLMREFYDAIFQDDVYQNGLGATTTAAKIATYAQSSFWSELVETFVLFGDPATQFGIPTNYPYVGNTIPAAGASDVRFDQDIQIIFNKPMVTTTVSLGGEGTAGLPFTPTWSAENTIVNYAHSDFGCGELLTFTVSGEDRLGNPLGVGPVPSTWSFTVSEDSVAPSGVIGVEGDVLTNVPVTATIVTTFSEPMRTSSVDYTIMPATYGWLSWDEDGQIARFGHYADFQGGETYTFMVTAAQDLAGNSLAEPLEITFTTEETYSIYLPVVLRNR